MLRKVLIINASLLVQIWALNSDDIQKQTKSIQNEYLQYYENIKSADKAFATGEKEKAKELYQNALSGLIQIKEKAPDWEPSIIRYRISYVKDVLDGKYYKTYDGWHYIEQNSEITIVANETASGEIVIPSEINGIPVRRIGTSWRPVFGWKGTNITGVVLPESVKEIGGEAFYRQKTL